MNTNKYMIQQVIDYIELHLEEQLDFTFSFS